MIAYEVSSNFLIKYFILTYLVISMNIKYVCIIFAAIGIDLAGNFEKESNKPQKVGPKIFSHFQFTSLHLHIK